MATSDERRKVAEDLRDLRDDCYHIRYAEQFYEELREIVALDLDGSFEGVANSLADLIDPTCELIDRSDISGEPVVCSCCGKMLNRNIRWHYCPSCGARVVSGDE